MKVLFAVHDEKVSLSIVKKYQKEYKEIISYKNVYYFNAILKEIQRDKSYDRIIIDEDLEEFTSTSYEEKDRFVFNKLDSITDEASNTKGKDIPIILICTERRIKSDEILVKLFGIGIYNAIVGNDRSTDEVCRLINSPRSKKDAKNYYKIDSKNVEYDPEDENDVSEEEMQHILSYFKKLGRNADKYDECFKKIASQYNEKQMKIIIAILPKNVKDILQDVSTEYQKFVPDKRTDSPRTTKAKYKPIEETAPTSEKLLDSKKNSKKQIIIPSSLDKNIIKKVTIKKPISITEYDDDFEDDDDDFEDDYEERNKRTEEVQEQSSKKRGRPSKKILEENSEKTKRKIATPHKISDEEDIENRQVDISDLDINTLPGINDEPEGETKSQEKLEPINENLLRPKPIIEDVLPGFEDEEENEDIDNYEDTNKDDIGSLYNEDRDSLDYDEVENEKNEKNEKSIEEDPFERQNYNTDYKNNDESKEYNYGIDNNQIPKMEMQSYNQSNDEYDYTNYNNLLSSERKVIAFVGTSKNGTSFIVNNIAKVLSDNGINTAILDTTHNKNSYYIYNDNDDNLRNDAANSIERLIQGQPGGMRVAKNLSVYVEIPGQDNTRINEVGPILENLIQNHSATLLDCDFSTPFEYFEKAQEIYLIQSMDVLTIQPLTAFLKELKNREILEQRKLRIVINKAVRLRGITAKKIVGGMSRYNNPEMSMMTELFDRNAIIPIEIPFDMEVYAKYLEGLAECNISISKYPKDFQNLLNKLSNIIYPLLPARKTKDNSNGGYNYSNGYTSGFSDNVNNTLNNMRKKY